MNILPLLFFGLLSFDIGNDLIITARLDTIAAVPDCGYFYFGATAKYSDIVVLQGHYDYRFIFVVHGCPELARSGEDGTLQAFNVGNYHRLVLTRENIHNIRGIKPIDSSQTTSNDSVRFFAKRVDLFK